MTVPEFNALFKMGSVSEFVGTSAEVRCAHHIACLCVCIKMGSVSEFVGITQPVCVYTGTNQVSSE